MNMKYFIGFLAIVGVIILTVILVIRGFSGEKVVEKPKLNTYSGTSTVLQLTIDGEVNAQQDHQAIRMTVGRSETRIEVLKGYEYQVVNSKTYQNTQESYTAFLSSLELLGYTKGSENSELKDERGYCPSGTRNIFAIYDGIHEVQRYWKTSCGDGNFKGEHTRIISLFKKQIPDFGAVTKGVKL